MFFNKLWSRKFVTVGSFLFLVMAFFLTGCSGSGSGGGNANSVTIEPIAGSLVQQKMAGIEYYSIQKDFNVWNDTSHGITLSDSVTNQQYQQCFGQYISTGNENYLKMLISKSVTAKVENKICSCIVITEKGEQTTIPSGQSTKITVVTYGPTDESTLEIYYKGGFQTKIQYGEGAEDLDTDYTTTGHLGDTIQLMGKQTLYGVEASDFHKSSSVSGNTLVCALNLNCTAKSGNSVQDGDFEVKVTKKSDGKTTTYYAGNTDSTGDLHLSHQTAYLAEDASFATELTLTATSSFADGDTIEVKYWPKQNASEGSPVYRRAYCTWKITVYEKDGALSLK